VESYLKHQGDSFVKRFDANSYLYITKSMDYFDLSNGFGSLKKAFANVKTRFLIVSLSSDWLFPSYQSKEIVSALRWNNIDTIYTEIKSNKGHDGFLLEYDQLTSLITNFLKYGSDGK
jgi:homoserine O-acetyltransferase